jgi:hypothetical protein
MFSRREQTYKCVLTPHATAAGKKSGDKRESFFSNVPPPATLIFTRAALFIAQEKHEHQQKQRFFLFWSAASVCGGLFSIGVRMQPASHDGRSGCRSLLFQ